MARSTGRHRKRNKRAKATKRSWINRCNVAQMLRENTEETQATFSGSDNLNKKKPMLEPTVKENSLAHSMRKRWRECEASRGITASLSNSDNSSASQQDNETLISVYKIVESSESDCSESPLENVFVSSAGAEVYQSEEDVKIEIEDFDSDQYVVKFLNDVDTDETKNANINGIDISCVKQEVDVEIGNFSEVQEVSNNEPTSVTIEKVNDITSIKQNIDDSSKKVNLNNNFVLRTYGKKKTSEAVKIVKKTTNTKQESYNILEVQEVSNNIASNRTEESNNEKTSVTIEKINVNTSIKQNMNVSSKQSQVNNNYILKTYGLKKTSKAVKIVKNTINTNQAPFVSNISKTCAVPTYDSITLNEDNGSKKYENVMIDTRNPAYPKLPLNQVCILCAAHEGFENGKRSIVRFARLILGFSGVNILQWTTHPVCCFFCYKQLQLIDNFRKQIMYTNNLISTSDMVSMDHNESNAFRSSLKSSSIHNEATNTEIVDLEDEHRESSESDNDGWWYKYYESDKKTSTISTETDKVEKEVNSGEESQGTEEKNADEDTVICAKCGKQFAKEKYMLKHDEYMHGASKHLCQVCGKVFNHFVKLERHMRSHTSEKPYTCPFCQRGFSLRWNLIQHKRLHTNTFPYKCKLCSAAYRHNVTLKRHIATSHSVVQCVENYSQPSSVNDIRPCGNKELIDDDDDSDVPLIPVNYIPKKKKLKNK